MKKIAILLSLILLLGCKSKTIVPKTVEMKTIRISTTAINENQKNKAYELGKRILKTCNTSKFKPFNSSEATPSVIENMTPDRLTKTCLKFRLRYGNFNDLKFVEAFLNEKDSTTIFRFKALYEKKIAHKEFRIYMNYKNQISSVKSLDWIDTFQDN